MATARRTKQRVDRTKTARALLRVEIEKLPAEERHIVERFVSRRRIARNVLREFDDHRTFGERIADRVAAVGGSWTFIFCFLGALAVWMLFNTWVLVQGAFDPYPYILLNLLLSCLAAIQAPIIMMSQNRQAAADRMNAENDYQVNVKSELEILQVHEKLDVLRAQDWATLVELQNSQIEMLRRLLERADIPLPNNPS